MELEIFWKDVLILMRQPPDESKLHDVARLVYVVKESIIPETLEDTESKVRALADPGGGPRGPGPPLTPGFEAPKLSFLGPLLIVLYFF